MPTGTIMAPMPTRAVPQQQAPAPVSYIYDFKTKNQSFLTMHYYLKSKGYKNNAFMLILFDTDLVGVDPYDPNLSPLYKQKILIEIRRNLWYFIREVSRIPQSGGPPSSFQLDRANMAVLYLLQFNINIYEEIPRQCGKTQGIAAFYLWLYNFRTQSSNIVFLNKKMETTKENLQRLKDQREALPSYLRFETVYGLDGKPLKTPNTVEYITNPINKNRIKCLPSATSEGKASNLLRGKSLSGLWIDEAGFIPYLASIITNGMPALRTSMDQCKKNGAPHGIIYTSTPGSLTNPDAEYFYRLVQDMTEFDESWYDLTLNQLFEILNANQKSSFVKIRYNYRQLGKSEDWFKNLCKDMGFDYDAIRREVLLNWEATSKNCPFSKDELETVGRFVREPVSTILVFGKYKLNIYKTYDNLMQLHSSQFAVGCDVSAGSQSDSSTMVVVDARTSELVMEFNCNYISIMEFARVIIEVVTSYLPLNNTVVTVERNGVGHGLLSRLVQSPIKRNLYFEIKDKVIDERNDGAGHITRTKQRVKQFGLYNTQEVRLDIMDLLMNRVQNFPHLITSKLILKELEGLERKGDKIDHSTNTHDDTIFGYMLALYPLYYGKNIKENWNIDLARFKTIDSCDDEMFDPELDEHKDYIVEKLANLENDLIKQQMQYLATDKSKLYNDYFAEERRKDEEALKRLLNTKLGRKAYMETYHSTETDLKYNYGEIQNIPDDVFLNFYKTEDQIAEEKRKYDKERHNLY